MRELRYSDYYATYEQLKYSGSYGVQGNNVLQLEPVHKEVKKKKKKPHLHIVEQKKPKRNLYNRAQVMQNRVTLAVTMIALVAVCMSCIRYLELQADVSGMADTIGKLEAQYVDLKTENDLTEVIVNSTIDYNNVIDVAMNELGMVYAGEDQVIEYDSTKMEVVKQLGDIPQK